MRARPFWKCLQLRLSYLKEYNRLLMNGLLDSYNLGAALKVMNCLRRQLLSLAEQVQAWGERSRKAHAAGEKELAVRAERHVQTLMEQGRALWSELETLGRDFQGLDQQISDLRRQATSQSTGRSLDEDWALFEARQELEELRQRQGLN